MTDASATSMERAAALERQGHWTAAESAYAEIFQAALVTRDILGAVDALRGQSRALRQQQRYDHAEDLALLSQEIAERHGLEMAAARAINTIATIRYFQEDWSGARVLYSATLERAREIGDDDLMGLVFQNLGVVMNLLGDLREARLLYLESICSSVRSQNKESEMMAYNNLGKLCLFLEEWLEAGLYLDRGIEIAERLGNTDQLSRLCMNRAEAMIQMDELRPARSLLDRANELALRVMDREIQADVQRFHAAIARREGDHEGAASRLARALEISSGANLALEHAKALEELALLQRDRGDEAAAIETLRQARVSYEALNARWNLEKVDGLLERWTNEGATC